ncbi:MAG: FtsQ-type POTRA domain-containing protein, partial [Spirochaetales bacterium]|nr:FtsQ-type POTRA domain-containing protein [Spirochaetales bacterium]
MTLKMRLLLLFSLFALLLVGTWLYTTPAYTVRQVAITVSGGPEAIPEQARQLLSTQVGTQLLRLRTGEIASQLRTLATIEDVQIGRRFPNTLTAHLDLVESPVVIHASDEDVYYLIKEGKLVGLSKADAALYTKSAVTVEIPASYAQMMVRWGVDRLFGQVVELARDLDSESSLITRVKYDNNSSNSFG